MRKFTAPILLALAVLLLSPTEGWSLPPCPGSPTRDAGVARRWTNCVGTFTHFSGPKYAGEFRNGLLHGQGTFTFANGDKYVGEWRNNKKHGQGTFTYASGQVLEGIWERGIFRYARKSP